MGYRQDTANTTSETQTHPFVSPGTIPSPPLLLWDGAGDKSHGRLRGLEKGECFYCWINNLPGQTESRALRIRQIPTELSLPALHPARSCFGGAPHPVPAAPQFPIPLLCRAKLQWVFPRAFPSLGRSWLLLLRSDNLAKQTWHRERDNSQPRQRYLD